MLSRLRLAIELDCDARVLRRGAAPRAYGSLLIEVAQNASPLTLSALGFADESSQLYQRILALRGPAASFARTRGVLAAMRRGGGRTRRVPHRAAVATEHRAGACGSGAGRPCDFTDNACADTEGRRWLIRPSRSVSPRHAPASIRPGRRPRFHCRRLPR